MGRERRRTKEREKEEGEIIKKVRKVKEMLNIEYEEYSEEVGSESRLPGTDITPLQHFIQSQRLNIRSHTHAHSTDVHSKQTVQTQAHTHAVLAHTSHTHTVQYIHTRTEYRQFNKEVSNYLSLPVLLNSLRGRERLHFSPCL